MTEIAMKSLVTQWGNSIGVRIPKAFAEEIGLRAGNAIDLEIENEKIVISKTHFSLEEMLPAINQDNIHGEQDFGKISGNEIW